VDHFTPGSAALGGALIGLSAALLWITNGRIAGISGIVGSFASDIAGPRGMALGERGWRLAFLAGLLAAPLLYALALGAPPAIQVTSDPVLLAVAGLLVGFGTRLGGGCTSGHGVCGLARLSRRSMVATALFMAAAFVTVFLAHHVFGG
jgi:uncharacterized membrane protein YedE/YeeE